MNIRKLTKASAQGEDSTRQFKADAKNADSLASEMAVCLRQRFTVSRWKNCRGAEATNDHE